MNADIQLWLYPLVIIVTFLLAYAYRLIAIRQNIVDKPNHRSLHTIPTIRGGGIIFPLALILALFIHASTLSMLMAVSLILISIISFWDDVDPRTPSQRFSIHLLVAAIWCFYLYSIVPIWGMFFAVIIFIAFLNAYNFMDGINGITVLYTLAIWGLLRIFETTWLVEQWGSISIVAMDSAIIVFSYFNIRKKALFFSGDVGAISIACFIAVNICLLMVRDHSFHWLALVALYGVDSSMTILRRMIQKEKIWEAHRKHAFQFLVSSFGWQHLQVSFLYAIVQFLAGGIVIWLWYQYGFAAANIGLVVLLITILIPYIYIVYKANGGTYFERKQL